MAWRAYPTSRRTDALSSGWSPRDRLAARRTPAASSRPVAALANRGGRHGRLRGRLKSMAAPSRYAPRRSVLSGVAAPSLNLVWAWEGLVTALLDQRRMATFGSVQQLLDRICAEVQPMLAAGQVRDTDAQRARPRRSAGPRTGLRRLNESPSCQMGQPIAVLVLGRARWASGLSTRGAALRLGALRLPAADQARRRGVGDESPLHREAGARLVRGGCKAGGCHGRLRGVECRWRHCRCAAPPRPKAAPKRSKVARRVRL